MLVVLITVRFCDGPLGTSVCKGAFAVDVSVDSVLPPVDGWWTTLVIFPSRRTVEDSMYAGGVATSAAVTDGTTLVVFGGAATSASLCKSAALVSFE